MLKNYDNLLNEIKTFKNEKNNYKKSERESIIQAFQKEINEQSKLVIESVKI